MIVIKEPSGCPIKLWVNNIEDVETGALEQLKQLSKLPFVKPYIAIMPDIHSGIGACIGSVIPTTDCIIPSAVGVDIGCGCIAIKTGSRAREFIEKHDLIYVRKFIEANIPIGRTENGDSKHDNGSWTESIPHSVEEIWYDSLNDGFNLICENIYDVSNTNSLNHLGTLGSGNHFIELSEDENGFLWVMVHSGSRGVGNRLGVLSIRTAKEVMERYHIKLENPDLAYLPRDTKEFENYMFILKWCQDYARLNRILMAETVLEILNLLEDQRISCHHNYLRIENHIENHHGKNLYITRKGAIRAGLGDWGVIPGSMGTKSYIVKGKGNPDSFESASHGAGRKMSRTEARKLFSSKDAETQTLGIECRKDPGIVDEIPGAYKNIENVMELQSDLVEIVHTLTPMLCIKG